MVSNRFKVREAARSAAITASAAAITRSSWPRAASTRNRPRARGLNTKRSSSPRKISHQAVFLHRAGDRRRPDYSPSLISKCRARGAAVIIVRCGAPRRAHRRKSSSDEARRPRLSLVYRPALVFRPDRKGARRRGADQECRVAAAVQRGRGGKATRGGSGTLPEAGAAPRARRSARTVTAGDSKARKVAASAVAGAVKATATTRASAR